MAHPLKTHFGMLDHAPGDVAQPNQQSYAPVRTFRCPTDVWEAFRHVCERDGLTVSESIRMHVERVAAKASGQRDLL